MGAWFQDYLRKFIAHCIISILVSRNHPHYTLVLYNSINILYVDGFIAQYIHVFVYVCTHICMYTYIDICTYYIHLMDSMVNCRDAHSLDPLFT
jgi:hypothetical protein